MSRSIYVKSIAKAKHLAQKTAPRTKYDQLSSWHRQQLYLMTRSMTLNHPWSLTHSVGIHNQERREKALVDIAGARIDLGQGREAEVGT